LYQTDARKYVISPDKGLMTRYQSVADISLIYQADTVVVSLGIPGTRYVHYGAWLYVYPVRTVLLTKKDNVNPLCYASAMRIAIHG